MMKVLTIYLVAAVLSVLTIAGEECSHRELFSGRGIVTPTMKVVGEFARN